MTNTNNLDTNPQTPKVPKFVDFDLDGGAVHLPLLDPDSYSDGKELMRIYSKFQGIFEVSKSVNEASFELYTYLVDNFFTKENIYKDLQIDWYSPKVPFIKIAGYQYQLINNAFLGYTLEE